MRGSLWASRQTTDIINWLPLNLLFLLRMDDSMAKIDNVSDYVQIANSILF